MTITPGLCRAARALLNMSQEALAEAASLSRSTIADFERDDRMPGDSALAAITAAFDVGGVEFISGDRDGGEGLRRKEVELWLYSGPDLGPDKNARFGARFYGTPYTFSVSREPLEDIGLKGGIIERDDQVKDAANAMLTQIKIAARRHIRSKPQEQSFDLRSRDFYG